MAKNSTIVSCRALASKLNLWLLTLLCMSSDVLSENISRIYGINLPYRLNEMGEGGYNRLLDELRMQGLQFDLSILPLKRWHNRTRSDKESCLFPVSVNALQTYDASYNDISLISSQPVDWVSLRVFTAPNRPVINTMDQLQGKRVATWKSHDSEPFTRDYNLSPDESRNESSQLQMLYAGRLDAIIGFAPDVNIAATSLKLPRPVYSPELSLLDREGATLVCHDTEANRKLTREFDRLITKMKKSGKLHQLLGSHASVSL
jgi:hypothetical protein